MSWISFAWEYALAGIVDLQHGANTIPGWSYRLQLHLSHQGDATENYEKPGRDVEGFNCGTIVWVAS